MRSQKRFLSLILAFVMAISLLPATAFATGEDGTEASDSVDLDNQTFAIVNKAEMVAMLANGVNNNNDGNRAGQQVNLSKDKDGSYYITYWTDNEKNSITQWTFEKVKDNEGGEDTSEDQYYISTGENTDKKYLKIGSGSNGDSAVTLSSTQTEASKVTVTKESDTGLYKLANSDGAAVNLFGSKAANGFGSYKVTSNTRDPNEWQALCTMKQVSTVDGTSPIGTTIDLFDYWVTSK